MSLQSRKASLNTRYTESQARKLFSDIQAKFDVPALTVTDFIENRNDAIKFLGESIDDITLESLLQYLSEIDTCNGVYYTTRINGVSAEEQYSALFNLKLIDAIAYLEYLITYDACTMGELITDSYRPKVVIPHATTIFLKLLMLDTSNKYGVSQKDIMQFIKQNQLDELDTFELAAKDCDATLDMVMTLNLLSPSQIASLIKNHAVSIRSIKTNSDEVQSIYKELYEITSTTEFLELIGFLNDDINYFLDNLNAVKFMGNKLTDFVVEVINLFNIKSRQEIIGYHYSNLFELDIEKISAALPPITRDELTSVLKLGESNSNSYDNIVAMFASSCDVKHVCNQLLCTESEVDNLINESTDLWPMVPLNLASLPISGKKIAAAKAGTLTNLVNDDINSQELMIIVKALSKFNKVTGQQITIDSRKLIIATQSSNVVDMLATINETPHITDSPDVAYWGLLDRSTNSYSVMNKIVQSGIVPNEDLYKLFDGLQSTLANDSPGVASVLPDEVVIELFKNHIDLITDKLLDRLDNNVIIALDEFAE